MSPETTPDLVHETRQERQRLVRMLEDLSDEQWDAPSLCAGWRIRDVIAHMTMPARTSPLSVLLGTARNGFSFNRFAEGAARDAATRLDRPQLLADLQAHVTSTWTPPGGGQLGALSHDLIHGLDVTEPLGLPRPPVDRVALVLGGVKPRLVRYFGVDLGGAALEATDAPVTIGSGATVYSTSACDVLLVVTGRRPLHTTPGQRDVSDRPSRKPR